jgi:hypothetical protein
VTDALFRCFRTPGSTALASCMLDAPIATTLAPTKAAAPT